MKPCIIVMIIMKICMWIFNGPRFNFERITGLLNLVIFGIFVLLLGMEFV